MKPSIGALLSASGYTTFTPELVKQASGILYGNLGAGLDKRDWDSILSSGNALEAAQTALEQQYQDHDYLKENADHLKGAGYSAAQIEKTYRSVKKELGVEHDTSWADGTVYEDAAGKSDDQLSTQSKSDAANNLSDTAANLAATSAYVRNNATDITATNAATVAEAEVIADATNVGTTTFDVSDGLTNVLGGATDGTALNKNGLNDAGTITVDDLTNGNEAVTFDNLGADSAATTIDFTDDTATLTDGEWNTIANTNSLDDNADNKLTVTGVADSSGDFTNDAAIDKLEANDKITFDGNAATLTATNAQSVFDSGTKDVSATSGDALTITMDGTDLEGTEANDIFDFAGTETGDAITEFGTDGTDKIDIADTTTAVSITDMTGGVAMADDAVFFLGGQSTGSADTDGAAATALSAAFTNDVDIGTASFAVIVDDDSSAIYKVTNTGTDADDIATTDITLVGTVDATLTTADITI